MDIRTLVAREADEADLARLLRLQDGLHPSAFGKNAIRIGVANHFVKLEQIDPVSLKTAQRLVDLTRGGGPIASIDLGHKKGFLPVTVAQRVAHSDFTLAVVIVPAVVKKTDPLIKPCADDPNAFLGIRLFAEMIATEPNERDFLFGAAQRSIRDTILGFQSRDLLVGVCQENGRRRKPEEPTPGNGGVRCVVSARS